MDVGSLFEAMPFARLLGIEVTEATNGHAEGKLEFREEFLSNPTGSVAHGAVAYALCDTVGGAAVISLSESVTPTIDMRIDYLRPVTRDLEAIADVRRLGGSIAVVDVDVTDSDGQIATARGAYKTGDYVEDTAWTNSQTDPSRTGSGPSPGTGSSIDTDGDSDSNAGSN